MDLGKIIKIGRIKKNITQEKLASILGMNKVSIWAWESNKYSPSGEMLIKVIQVLDIAQDLFPGKESKTEDRLARIERVLEEKGLISVETNNGHIVGVVNAGNIEKRRKSS